MTDTQFLADFRAIPPSAQDDVLGEWPGREQDDPPCRLRLSERTGRWNIEYQWPDSGKWACGCGSEVGDYEAACIIMRQATAWLDDRGIEVVRYKQTGRFTIWNSGTRVGDFGDFPSRESATIAAITAAKE